MKKFGIKTILFFSAFAVCFGALLLLIGADSISYVVAFTVAIYFGFGFLFFKIITIDQQTMAITYCFNPFRKTKVFRIDSFKKLIVETSGVKSTIQVIQIFFNDGRRKGIACILSGAEQEKLQKTMEGYGIESVLWP